MLRIERLKDDDIKKICSFFKNADELNFAFPDVSFYPLSYEEFKTQISCRSDFSVVKSGNEIAGYGDIYNLEVNKSCFLGHIIINPDFRKKGVGSFLLTNLINIAENKYNISEVNLMCWRKNTNALKFYKDLGFVTKNLYEKNINGNNVEILLMTKNLK